MYEFSISLIHYALVHSRSKELLAAGMKRCESATSDSGFCFTQETYYQNQINFFPLALFSSICGFQIVMMTSITLSKIYRMYLSKVNMILLSMFSKITTHICIRKQGNYIIILLFVSCI